MVAVITRISPSHLRPAIDGEYDGLNVVQRLRQRYYGDAAADVKVGVARLKNEGMPVVNDRNITLIANTDDIDMQREVVLPAGAVTTYFDQNKSIFVDHDYRWQSLVGKMRNISPYPSAKNHKQWRVQVAILELQASPICNDILTVAREWGIGSSIGFEGLEGGPPTPEEMKAFPAKGALGLEWVTRKWLWLELSVTAMPCNVPCQSVGEREEKTAAYLDDAVVKGRISRKGAVAMGLPGTAERKLHAAAPRRTVVVVPN